MSCEWKSKIHKDALGNQGINEKTVKIEISHKNQKANNCFIKEMFIGHLLIYICIKPKSKYTLGGIFMKGYIVREGYMGLVEGEYMLFACEEDYQEYLA